MPKEVEVPQPLGLGVMDPMPPFDTRRRKPAAGDKVDGRVIALDQGRSGLAVTQVGAGQDGATDDAAALLDRDGPCSRTGSCGSFGPTGLGVARTLGSLSGVSSANGEISAEKPPSPPASPEPSAAASATCVSAQQ